MAREILSGIVDIYDEELSTYYLKNRYYCALHNRFLQSDYLIYYSNTNISHNVFAYALNSPIINKDAEGNASKTAIDDGEDRSNPRADLGGGGGLVGRINQENPSNALYYNGPVSNGVYSSPAPAPAPAPSARFTPDQQALNALVKPFAKANLISLEDTRLLIKWAFEVDFKNSRIDPPHTNHAGIMSTITHAHIGVYDHIPISGNPALTSSEFYAICE